MDKLDCMRFAGKVNQEAIELGFDIAKGMMLGEIDAAIEQYILDHNCRPAFKNYQPPGAKSPFPATACLSPNSVVVHGIPNDYFVEPGDLLTIDLGVEYNGWFVDSARSRVIAYDGSTNHRKAQDLIDATEAILNAQLSVLKDECTFLEVVEVSEAMARNHNVVILPQWGGHKIGDKVHIDPFIPNAIDTNLSNLQQQLERKKYARMTFKEGDTICLEPVVSYGNTAIIVDADLWTIRKADGNLAAHTERCVLVTKTGYEILS